MGVGSRKPPPLPAPTETETDINTPTEATATELSRLGDEKSTYSIPEDGTPVTIRTRGPKANKSQTSLLIEYFEGSKANGSGASNRKPSVRVRLTPSKKGKGDHIQVTESKGSRKASLTRRIPLDEALGSHQIDLAEGEDLSSLGSYASATEESNVSRNPIDIEIEHPHRRRRPASPLIPSGAAYQPGNPSEISAIPTDSFLDGSGPATELRRASSPSRGGSTAAHAAAAIALGSAAMTELSNNKTRRSGGERTKSTADTSRDKSERKRRPKSRTSSVSEQAVAEEMRSPRRRSGRSHQDPTVSAADSSVLSSNLTQSHRSADAHSMRSGTSKSSINNPKLLETVEDAIRRLILPELSALKREQSKRETRRGSITSTGTSNSKEELSASRRRSSGHRGDVPSDSPRRRERRNREARHDFDEGGSLHSQSYDSLEADYLDHEGDTTTPRRSNHLLKAAAAGAAGAVLAKGLASVDDAVLPEDRKQRERRRRRAESARSRSLGRERYAEEYDEEEAPAPPMPLMSDINPSELTRTSILSADSERPHSASEEFTSTKYTTKEVHSTGSATPSSGLSASFHALGTQHANVSHGDLTDLPRGKKEYVEEYETDEFGGKIPMPRFNEYEEEDARDASDSGDYPEEGGYDNSYYSTQDVPPPLKYVPYQAGTRGLSPIPSVSGYTEGGSEAQHPRTSRNLQSSSGASTPRDRSPVLRHSRSNHSLNSVPSNMRSREFDRMSPGTAPMFSPRLDQRQTTLSDESHEGHSSVGHAVRGIAANPQIFHPLTGVESNVASLVDGSMLDQSVLTNGSGFDHIAQRESSLSYDSQSRERSSRASSDKLSMDSPRKYEHDTRRTPGMNSQNYSPQFTEYEIDEHGRKVPRTSYRHSPTASEAAITAGAVGAAAAALKAAQEKRQVQTQDGSFVPAGVNRNKSFKERTLEGREPRSTPTHSIDRLAYDETPKLGASGMPDMRSPMPELGYMEDDLQTNPSVVEERLDGHDEFAEWSGRATPTPRDYESQASHRGEHWQETPTKQGGLGITEAVGVAVLGAAAGMAAAHSREPSQENDDWHRTSTDRKRDTLVTNPYEDASPVANPNLNQDLLEARGMGHAMDSGFHGGNPTFGQKYDEGYMSNGPITSPESAARGKAVDMPRLGDDVEVEDPFYVSKGQVRHPSGMSHGMASPLYDASTGGGIDHIENKDIVALMQHLMVRDAQRSARDTEIVALLMNAALEMRTSFREMKDMIQDTGDDVIFAGVENTEKLQKSINGPRPYPGTGSRSVHSNSQSQAGTLDDVALKKKNLWRRALQGLSAKGTSDLTRIEDMLMQLLGEVDVLKTQTAPVGATNITSGRSMEHLPELHPDIQDEQDAGYEAEGVSTGSHSGHLSLPQPSRLANERKVSDSRITTVLERDEEDEDYRGASPAGRVAHDANLLSPGSHHDVHMRGSSVPLDSPPHHSSQSAQQPLSAENTPRTEKGKKHKSTSSNGWLPKISRWSETTASSVGKAFRGGDKTKKDLKYDDYLPPSRSGSSLASYEASYRHDPDEDKLQGGFSDPQLSSSRAAAGASGPSGLAPMMPEDPKYKAHRNSLNLQHPQPRAGQTERFRTALEYSAQDYYDPVTPRSADWAGSATSLNRLPPDAQRYNSSAEARDGEHWSPSTQQAGPPRPPKEPLEGQTVQSPPSSRANRIENKNLSGAYGGPARRPSGPRAMTPKSSEEDAAREERRRKRGKS